jgi:methyl-accepting chemotaxis protein
MSVPSSQRPFGEKSSRAKSLLSFGGVLILVLLLNSSIGLHTLQVQNEAHRLNLKNLNLGVEALDHMRSAQVHFKKQAQEWKNTLLRGQNRADFDRYLAAFTTEEGEVAKDLALSKDQFSGLEIDPQKVDKLVEELKKLGATYRAAIKSFDPADAGSAQKVDASVRGIDRAVTGAMDGLVEEIRKGTEAQQQRIARETEKYYQLARKMAWAGTAAAAALAIGVLAVAMMGQRR